MLNVVVIVDGAYQGDDRCSASGERANWAQSETVGSSETGTVQGRYSASGLCGPCSKSGPLEAATTH